MLFAFLSLSSCYNIRGKDAEKLFTESEHKPIFVVLYSQWCPHCHEFKPVKEQLESFYKGSKSIDMTQINCDQERELCSKFEGSGTPRIYITTSTIEKAEKYDSSRTLEELKAFIKKYIEPPILQISSNSQLKSEIKQNYDSSIFILQDLDNTKISKIIEKLAANYVSYPCQFFNLTYKKYNTDSPVLFQLYPHTKKVINITNNVLTEARIKKFVEEHIYPSFSQASSHFFEIQKYLREPFLVIDDWKHTFTSQLREMTVYFPENLKSVDIECKNYDKFCRALHFNPMKAPSIAIVNTYRDTYFDFNGNKTKEELVKWVNDVWNGKVKEKGRGAGVIGFFRRNVIPYVKDVFWWMKVAGVITIFYLIRYVVGQIKQLIILRNSKDD